MAIIRGMTVKPSREQKPLYNRFIKAVDTDDFQRDIESLRNSDADITKSTFKNVEIIRVPDGDDIINSDEVPSPLHQVMMKYELPLAMDDFVRHYVAHGEIALDKIRSGVYLVDHKSMEASGGDDRELNYHWYINDTDYINHNKYIEVTLAIPAHATITQINDTISQHKQFILDRQEAANNGTPVGRVRLAPAHIRNREIMKLYNTGLKPSQILWELPDDLRGELTSPDISKIIYKQRKKQ